MVHHWLEAHCHLLEFSQTLLAPSHHLSTVQPIVHVTCNMGHKLNNIVKWLGEHHRKLAQNEANFQDPGRFHFRSTILTFPLYIAESNFIHFCLL